MNDKISTKNLLLIGIIASIFVGTGEYLLHFLPEGPGGEMAMLEKVPLKRASIGHFLVIFAGPLYFVGYYGLFRVFQKTNGLLALLLFIGGVLSFSIGGVWVSSRYFAAEVLQRSASTADHAFYLQSYEDHYQVLVWALRFLIVAVSIIYTILVLKNKETLPKWLAIFNPIVLLLIVISSLIWFKPLGVHIAPIAMNVTHFIFFGLIFMQIRKRTNY